MTYKYHCGNETIRVWVWDDDYHTTVSVRDNKTNKDYERTIREDDGGKFFTWNKNKIYLDSWIRISMQEVKTKIENKEWCTSDELCQAILAEGIDNVRCIVPLNIVTASVFGISVADGNTFKETLCKIKEDYLHEIKRNYKICFVPVETDASIIGSKDFYTTDLISLIRVGIVKIVT